MRLIDEIRYFVSKMDKDEQEKVQKVMFSFEDTLVWVALELRRKRS